MFILLVKECIQETAPDTFSLFGLQCPFSYQRTISKTDVLLHHYLQTFRRFSSLVSGPHILIYIGRYVGNTNLKVNKICWVNHLVRSYLSKEKRKASEHCYVCILQGHLDILIKKFNALLYWHLFLQGRYRRHDVSFLRI